MEDDGADALVGQMIDERYQVERLLGRGGMGAVYLATHLRMQKQVAIKCLHAGLSRNPEVVQRFKNEAVAASRIGHPNIIEVFDMGRFEDGTFYMVLEYLEGREWQHDLDVDGVMSPGRAAHIGIQVCDALAAAAASDIVHRDLKPENVFLTERGGDSDFVKVLDFGISKILDGSTGATKTGALMGTPFYMAPEQVAGEKNISFRVDLYALGVILFQALSGRLPFDGEALPQILLQIATTTPPSLGEYASELPVDLRQLVDQMLQKEPSARPQSFEEVAVRLAPHLPKESRLAGIERNVPAAVVAPLPDRLAPPLAGVAEAGTVLAAEPAASMPDDMAKAGTVLAAPAATLTHSATKRSRWMLVAAAGVALLTMVLCSRGEEDTDSPGAADTTSAENNTESPNGQRKETVEEPATSRSEGNGSDGSRSNSDSGSRSGSESGSGSGDKPFRKLGNKLRGAFR